jgi:hypothetical protein
MREKELIEQAIPCDTDYTDKTIQSVSDAKKKRTSSLLKSCAVREPEQGRKSTMF